MNFRALLFGLVLFAPATVSSAQEGSGRIDLDVLSRSPFPNLFAARIAFGGGQSGCPVDHGYLSVSRSMLWQTRIGPEDPRLNSNMKATILPIDDETQQYRVESPNCRFDIAVRQKVRRDGVWASLLVPEIQRSNVRLEARREIKPEELTPVEKERLEAADKARDTAGSLVSAPIGVMSMGFSFDNKPQTCLEVAGDYQIGRMGIIFSFLTGLPGDLNRFVIERTDLDANRSRLSFTRGDCQFELTVSQSLRRHGHWVALPIAPKE
jgi:hypothetical protein